MGRKKFYLLAELNSDRWIDRRTLFPSELAGPDHNIFLFCIEKYLHCIKNIDSGIILLQNHRDSGIIIAMAKDLTSRIPAQTPN